jgi:Abnormal spindle-like microcephaly-assoc'd, ASPM-SPD-2-Hydin/Beta-propeller repeat
MKTRGAWGNSAKFTGASTLICSVLLLTVLGGAGKRVLPDKRTKEAASGFAKPGRAKGNPRWVEAYGKLPLSFEENQGQTAHEVRYVSHGSGYELFLTPQEVVLALRPNKPLDLSPLHRAASIRALREARQAGQVSAIRMRLEGANPETRIAGMDQLPGKTNYFIGNDPKKWHTDVPSYARVKYSGIYPGVDLVFYGNQRRLEYDFVVAPDADPQAIQLNLEGARKLHISSHGDLVMKVSGGQVVLQRPVIYQNVRGERREIAGAYALAGDHRVTFAVGSYDRNEPLILDPVLNYSTYLGGSANDVANGIAVDSSGNAFLAGQTFSTDFPAGTNGAVVTPPATNSGASFVAELDPTGTKLLYSTYLVGTTTSLGDTAFAIALDSSGKVYVTGTTFATNFPTKSGLSISGNATKGVAYVTKLDPAASSSASLLYSTFLGGTGGDFGNAIAADAAGNAYVVGLTDSTDFRTKNPFQSAPGSTHGTAFLSRIDTTLSGDASLIYSTYLGGTASNFSTVIGPGYGDQAFGVAADTSNIAYVIGTTTSTDSSFITAATAYQTAPPAANTLASVFVSKIDTMKSGAGSLIYSTYLAGSMEDQGFAIALGPNNVAYLTGTTDSTDFPFPGATVGAFDTAGAITGKAFVTLVDTTKSGTASVTYSTYLGGTGSDNGFAIKTDASGNAYVAGTTASSDFAGAGTLKSLGAFQPALSNTAGNAFVAKLNPAGTGAADLLYATYFGGNGNGTTTPVPDQGFGIAIDSSNPPNAYIAGQTNSSDLPVFPKAPASPTAFQTSLNGTSDAYVAKLALIPTLAIVPASLDFGFQPLAATSVPKTVTVTNNNNVTVNFSSIATTGTNSADFAKASDTCSPSVAAGAQCTVSVTFTPSVAAAESATLVFTDDDVNSPQNVSLSGTGSNTAPGVGLAPTSLAFGGQLLTTTSASQTVTLTNNGNAPLTINSISTSLSDFAETNTCPASPATLAAGANCTISVTFAPTAVGARTAKLTITDDASGSPHTLPLTGTGWDFTLTAPASVSVKAGKSVNFNVTMTPAGGFNQAVALACSDPLKKSTCTPAPTSVTASDGTTVQTAVVTVTTQGLIVPPATPTTPGPPFPIRQIVPLVLALVLLLMLFTTSRLRTRLGMVTAILILLALAGCGYNGTKKGTTNLTITGQSGSVTKTVTVALTVT